jgi:hypothetical protein
MLPQPFHKSFYVPSSMIVTQYSKRLFPRTLTCFRGSWVIGLSGKICTPFFVVNNEYCFKRLLSNIYIVNFNMDLKTSIDIRPLGLTIMLDPRKYRFGECVRSKILRFDDQPNLMQTWVSKWCQTQNTMIKIS